ncbi:hypothetical protein NW759_017171 [Fusarium solani]|nr:hypothetical protein NW759_017171 [Fusarium solani]
MAYPAPFGGSVLAQWPNNSQSFDYGTVPVGKVGDVDYIRLLEILPATSGWVGGGGGGSGGGAAWPTPGFGHSATSAFGPWANQIAAASAPPQAPLSCRLISEPLRDGMPPFAALSYTWGDDKDVVTIRCNGRTLQITRSLLIALEALQNDHPAVLSRTQYIWADGICINQDKSSSDKPQQIPLMAELYRRATQVIVWLGPEHDPGPSTSASQPCTGPALASASAWQPRGPIMSMAAGSGGGPRDIDHAIPCIRKCANALVARPGASAAAMSMQEWAALGFYSVEELKLQLRAFYKLLQRRWFGRVWTIQEHAVARSVVILCGRHQISEADMINAGAFLASSGADSLVANWGKNPLILMYGIKSEQNAGAKPPLLNLLAHFRHRDAGDPKDKIYAVCDLASDSGPTGLNIKIDPNATIDKQDPNWREKARIDVGNLYRSVAIKFLCEYENLDIVSLAGRYTPATEISQATDEGRGRHADRPTLPSWVPDWSLPDSTVSIQLLEEKKMLRGPAAQSLGMFSGQYHQQPTYMFPLDQEPTIFAASGNTKYHFDLVTPGGPGLRVRGIILDRIARVGTWADEYLPVPSAWWADEPSENQLALAVRILDRLCDWMDLTAAESGRAYPATGEPLLDVFWQTMRCGHFRLGFARERQIFLEFYAVARSCMALCRGLRSQPWLRPAALAAHTVYKAATGGMNSGGWMSFLARTKMHTGNRGMFVTSTRGLVGLAPKGGATGDGIVIFQGGSVPFVVRAAPDGQNWEIVGACYVHGAMHGQLFYPESCVPMVIV